MKTGLFAALALVVLVFLLQNFQTVQFRFLFWKLEMSRALMLFATSSAGFALGWIASNLSRMRSQK